MKYNKVLRLTLYWMRGVECPANKVRLILQSSRLVLNQRLQGNTAQALVPPSVKEALSGEATTLARPVCACGEKTEGLPWMAPLVAVFEAERNLPPDP